MNFNFKILLGLALVVIAVIAALLFTQAEKRVGATNSRAATTPPPPQKSTAQKPTPVAGVVIESVEPIADQPQITYLNLRNISEKEIGCVVIYGQKKEQELTTLHYLDQEPFAPGIVRQASVQTEAAAGMKIVAVAYLDGQLEGTDSRARKRARDIHDGYTAELTSVVEKLERDAIGAAASNADPVEAIRRVTTPTGEKVKFYMQLFAAEFIRREIEGQDAAEQAARLTDLSTRIRRTAAKLKTTNAHQ